MKNLFFNIAKIVFSILIITFSYTDAAAQTVVGKYYKLVNGSQYGIASETMFFNDGTYITVSASLNGGMPQMEKGRYEFENDYLYYTDGKSENTIKINWISSTRYSFNYNGYVFIFQEYQMPSTSNSYVPSNSFNQTNTRQPCWCCNGTGKCHSCNATGIDYVLSTGPHKCSSCGGTGICKYCHGTGIFKE